MSPSSFEKRVYFDILALAALVDLEGYSIVFGGFPRLAGMAAWPEDAWEMFRECLRVPARATGPPRVVTV